MSALHSQQFPPNLSLGTCRKGELGTSPPTSEVRQYVEVTVSGVSNTIITAITLDADKNGTATKRLPAQQL